MFCGNVPGVMRLFHRLKQRPEKFERIFNRFLRPLFFIGHQRDPQYRPFFSVVNSHIGKLLRTPPSTTTLMPLEDLSFTGSKKIRNAAAHPDRPGDGKTPWV